MLLPALSLGCEVDVWRPQTGVVHSVFERTVNLRVGEELWSLGPASLPDSPFGIRHTRGGGWGALKAGDPVHVRAGVVRVGALMLDCRTAPRWSPIRWAPPAGDLAGRLSAMERAAQFRAWAESARMASDVTTTLRGGDMALAAAVRRTVGCGPGLTPAGDDVLVGMLALLTSGAAGGAGADATSRLARAFAPVLNSTNDISRHLLQQAARGLPGRALHDLGRAVIEGAPADVFSAGLALVLDTGATSGADACMGFAAACRHFFPTTVLLAA